MVGISTKPLEIRGEHRGKGIPCLKFPIVNSDIPRTASQRNVKLRWEKFYVREEH